MADGDPMVLQTRYGVPLGQTDNYQSMIANGPMDLWSDTASPPDGWGYTTAGGATVTHLRVAGARTSGNGTYYWRQTYSAVAASTQFGLMKQTFTIPGNAQLDARGVSGQTFYATIWLRNTGTGTVLTTFSIQEFDADGAYLGVIAQDANASVTASWTKYSISGAVSNAACAKIYFAVLMFTAAGGGGSPVIEADEAELYMTYTFDRNPTMPDDQVLSIPHRQMMRTHDGSLLRGRPASATARFEKRLRFGNIGLTQLKALRALYSLDTPMELTANHPHMPDVVSVRMAGDFNFRLRQGAAFGSNLYEGSLTLTEV